MILENHKFANIFPMMNDREFKELKEDLKEKGLQEEIIVFEDKILDGRNRYKGCKELEIKPKIRKYKGTDALSYVISTNLKRRNLNESQKAMIAIEHRKVFEDEAKKRMSEGGRGGTDATPSKSRDKLGEAFGVGGRIIDMAETIKEKAPEKVEAIEKGEEKISTVYREIKLEEQAKENHAERVKRIAILKMEKNKK